MRRVYFEHDADAAVHHLMDWQAALLNAGFARSTGKANLADMLENDARRAREKASDITASRYALPQYALFGVEAVAREAALRRQRIGGFLMHRAFEFAKQCGCSDERATEIVMGPALYALSRKQRGLS